MTYHSNTHTYIKNTLKSKMENTEDKKQGVVRSNRKGFTPTLSWNPIGKSSKQKTAIIAELKEALKYYKRRDDTRPTDYGYIKRERNHFKKKLDELKAEVPKMILEARRAERKVYYARGKQFQLNKQKQAIKELRDKASYERRNLKRMLSYYNSTADEKREEVLTLKKQIKTLESTIKRHEATIKRLRVKKNKVVKVVKNKPVKVKVPVVPKELKAYVKYVEKPLEKRTLIARDLALIASQFYAVNEINPIYMGILTDLFVREKSKISEFSILFGDSFNYKKTSAWLVNLAEKELVSRTNNKPYHYFLTPDGVSLVKRYQIETTKHEHGKIAEITSK